MSAEQFAFEIFEWGYMDPHSTKFNNNLSNGADVSTVDFSCNTSDTIFLIYGGNNATFFESIFSFEKDSSNMALLAMEGAAELGKKLTNIL